MRQKQCGNSKHIQSKAFQLWFKFWEQYVRSTCVLVLIYVIERSRTFKMVFGVFT